MSASTSLKHEIANRLIESDLMFSRRFLEGGLTDQGNTVIPTFCMNNYLSLFIYESHRTLKVIDPQRAALLAYNHEAVIEKARHSVKMFDGSKAGHVGVLGEFSGIIDAGREKYLNNTWFPPARVLETDLGEWRYRGRLVSTTQVASFFMGIPTMAVSDIPAIGQVLLAVAETQARYIDQVTRSLPWHGSSFMAAMSFSELKSRDRRSERYFKHLFDAALSDELAASLSAFQCSLNFLDVMVAADQNAASAETIFKLRFITLYHVLSSLTELKAEYGSKLDNASLSFLDTILTHRASAVIMHTDGRGFRNTLVHYTPEKRVVAQLSLSASYYGLVEAYYPAYDFPTLSQEVSDHTTRVATLLNEWAKG
ncbi:hypothetical protein [Streptomyces liliifuscus]|uniref:Uncharacterized protein n=1 Tax=Streptomyces liliifuscus TaxID=2797636 RepID=A0A7T7I5Y9_9ACTN|nr:hypothetical protein [Streptomyces liliifuscus]QQM41527.1 hypothetical protein JEQ17_20050 [Streptomyces liliifuscus]